MPGRFDTGLPDSWSQDLGVESKLFHFYGLLLKRLGSGLRPHNLRASLFPVATGAFWRLSRRTQILELLARRAPSLPDLKLITAWRPLARP